MFLLKVIIGRNVKEYDCTQYSPIVRKVGLEPKSEVDYEVWLIITYYYVLF